MDTLKIWNYDRIKCDTGVKLDDIDFLYVVVVSGDEIVTVTKKDSTKKTFDSADLIGNSRAFDFFDGEYRVSSDSLDEWTEREDSYYWFGRMMKDATV